ncbi:LysR substrate-binding domain-containing protein [Sphingomonas sp.]|uniref:LysR family transcriptional regulator n=1 Tax=Sphingomonas sp. TaxID=28214 RepID=UPI003B003903
MDRLKAMATFVTVVERGSFAAAAAAGGLSPAMVGNHVRYLEKRLGEPLLTRSTRRQALTDLGRDYYERCRRILEEVEGAEAAGCIGTPSSGTLRVTAPVVLGTLVLADTIARLVAENAALKVDLILRDDRLDLVSERIDVALRIGALPDSTLVQHALESLPLIMCATPDYLRRRGMPRSPADLDGHACLSFLQHGANEWPLRTGDETLSWSVSGPVRANSGLALRAFALAGLGIAMLPLCVVKHDLQDGSLREVLQDHGPRPLELRFLALPGRMDAPKVRRFVDAVAADWRAATLALQLRF